MTEGERIQRKAVRRAAEIVGGVERLALELDLAPAVVRAWLEGEGAPGDAEFLRTVDIILGHDARLPWSRDELEAELASRKPHA